MIGDRLVNVVYNALRLSVTSFVISLLAISPLPLTTIHYDIFSASVDVHPNLDFNVSILIIIIMI